MKQKLCILSSLALIIMSCNSSKDCEPCPEISSANESSTDIIHDSTIQAPSLVILGTIQDAGSPQINCHKACCQDLHANPDLNRMVVSIGLIDPENQKKYILEASPDMSEQLADLSLYENFSEDDIPNGVFLTHAHIGHYTGLMDFGKEALNAKQVPVYAMPKMKTFLSNNGPWSQLVSNENITIQDLKNETETQLTSNFTIVPFLVPHRDEYSETVGFKIIGPNKSALFIPDIDKWEKWGKNIIEEVAKVDYAFLDATFYDSGELNNRDMSEVPHPFLIETVVKFKDEPLIAKQKIHFIHFNHTNPILDSGSDIKETILDKGFNIAEKGMTISL